MLSRKGLAEVNRCRRFEWDTNQDTLVINLAA
jgi:hypothetical protein